MKRSPLILFGAAFSLLLHSGAQSSKAVDITVNVENAKLAFSSDGRTIHVTGTTIDHSGTGNLRATTYDTTTGVALHTINLQQDAMVLSTTSDGRTALINTYFGDPKHVELSVVDIETGKDQPLPATWYDHGEYGQQASLSADGRLLSIYSESGPADRPMTVTVYTWPGMTLVAKQTSEYTAAGGGFSGGITPDGHAIEFDNNRAGIKLVDLKTGQKMASFSPDSIRSANGTWVVDLPDMSFKDDAAPRELLIKDGANGQTRGKINVPVPDAVAYGQMTGAFCGATNRFVLSSGENVAAYAIPSGTLLTSFAVDTWRDPAAPVPNHATVACSATTNRMAILSGTRLTVHALQ